MTNGSVEPLKKLQRCWGHQVQFIDVIVRQAHPGPTVPTYHTYAEKMRHAQQYQQDEDLRWPVMVDNLAGTTHQVYGGLADPIYLIDQDGRVAFYNMWAHAPSLHEAIVALKNQGWRGVVNGGVDRNPHMPPILTDGWKGLRKGLPQSLIDIELAAPTMGLLTWLGYQLRPVLAPITLRAEPLPAPAKVGLAVGATAVALGALWLWQRNQPQRRALSRHEQAVEYRPFSVPVAQPSPSPQAQGVAQRVMSY